MNQHLLQHSLNIPLTRKKPVRAAISATNILNLGAIITNYIVLLPSITSLGGAKLEDNKDELAQHVKDIDVPELK
jgi:hypothetical protein